MGNLARLALDEAPLPPELAPLEDLRATSTARWARETGGREALPPDALEAVVRAFRSVPTLAPRELGAEANAFHSLVAEGHVAEDCRVVLLHSDTAQGRQVAALLDALHSNAGREVARVPIEGLDHTDADRFARVGLRELAKQLCKEVRERSPAACAVDATGGFKAQIAVAVQIGQALGVRVLYRHESFPRVIEFPPLPIALDQGVRRRASGIYRLLHEAADPVAASALEDDAWEPAFESLLDRIMIDGVEYVELSATGVILDEAFADSDVRDHELPPPAAKQFEPHYEKAGWPGKHPRIRRVVERLLKRFPQLVTARSWYYNRDLVKVARVTLTKGELSLVISDDGATAKLAFDSTAETDAQRAALLQAMNDWLSSERIR